MITALLSKFYLMKFLSRSETNQLLVNSQWDDSIETLRDEWMLKCLHSRVTFSRVDQRQLHKQALRESERRTPNSIQEMIAFVAAEVAYSEKQTGKFHLTGLASFTLNVSLLSCLG